MGYPLRWDSIAAPALERTAPERQEEDDEERAQARAAARYFRRLTLATMAGSAILVLSVIGVSRLVLADRASTLALDSAPASSAIAALPSAVRHAGYVVVSGTMTNRSARPLDRVEAVVDLLGADRRLLASQSAMVDRDRLAPGEGSSFHLAMSDVPTATEYRIHFRRLLGADL
jgi:hypothetical protein